jgi:hypothetical protein
MTAPERSRLIVLVGVLVVVAALAFWPRGGGGGETSARERAQAGGRRVAGKPGASTASVSPDAVPTLAALDPEHSGNGPVERDIFHFAQPTPTRVPTPAPPTPTPLPKQGEGNFIGPRPLTPTPTNTPIIPPPIPYKLVGMFGPVDRPIAAFEDNGRLINAREGDVLDGRFIVHKVNRESVDFAFVGLPKDITRRLPISEPGR